MAPNNLELHILKSLSDDLVRDVDLPELGSCLECKNEILSPNLSHSQRSLVAIHTIKFCIENKILPNKPSVCPFFGCEKTIETEAVKQIIKRLIIHIFFRANW